MAPHQVRVLSWPGLPGLLTEGGVKRDDIIIISVPCQFLQMKVTRYEHLVHIKDMKIEALKKELETAQLKGTRQPIHHTSYQRR